MGQKWIEVNDLSSGLSNDLSIFCSQKYKVKTSMLRSDLCHYSDAYIVVQGTIGLLDVVANENDKIEKMLCFKLMLHSDHPFQMLTVHS